MERSVWLNAGEHAAAHQIAPLPQRADVAVIGAGYTGLAAALELAKGGATVAVLEAHNVGWGGSSRNGGMVLSGLKLGPRELVAKFGVRDAAALDAAAIASIAYVERLIRENEITCDFVRCGHLALASKPNHFAEFQRDAEVVTREFGRPIRIVPRESLRDEIGSDAFFGGLVDEASASIDPAKYVTGLAQAAQRAGAMLYEQTKVEQVERRALDGEQRYVVTTSRGDIAARDVIVATGAYTGPEFPALRRRIVPIGSYVIATESLPNSFATEISPRNRMMFDSKHFLHYFRLTPDRRLLFGGRASFVPESGPETSASAGILRHDMLRVFPQLSATPIEYAWGGTIDFTFDMLPHAQRLDGVYYAAGYAGHGVAMATYLGAQVARMVAGESAAEPLLARAFPSAPLGLYGGTPWMLRAAATWFRLLDAVS